MPEQTNVVSLVGTPASQPTMTNDEGAAVALGDVFAHGSDGRSKYYCGRNLGRHAIPGSDGRCGPNNGPQCQSCQRFQATRTPAPQPTLTNDEGAALVRGILRRYYCGRNLGRHAIPGSDGRCGPNNGPQCESCQRFQAAQTTAVQSTTAAQSTPTNDEGAALALGDGAHGSDGSAKYYCGRNLGRHAIPGSDGRCGPNNGPQCQSCERFQAGLAVARPS